MNTDIIKCLLEDASIKAINYNKLKEGNGDKFNLLEISGISGLEVKMCRILAEILNPHGSHGQGIIFLKSFVSDVLEIDVTENELQNSTVVTEYPTSEQRRIDIVISIEKMFIPIEVKLFAKDQQSQCASYFKFANSKSPKQTKVYYLTIDGHLPYETDGLTPVKKDSELVGFEQLSNKIDYKYNNYESVRNYYVKKTSYPTPSLVYRYKNVSRVTEIWFLIEIGTYNGAYGGLHCGFVTAKSGENPGKVMLSEKELKKHIKLSNGLNTDEWYFYWEYLPVHVGEYYPDTSPDFKIMNEPYTDLFDEDKFENYIELCMKRIKTLVTAMIV